MRKIYYEVRELGEAKAILRNMCPPLKVETIPVRQALGRVTAEEILANRSVPHYIAAAYDGYAVDALVTYGASEGHPLELTNYRVVSTGDALEFHETCVIPLEDVIDSGGKKLIFKAFAEGTNVRQVGEDIIKGDLVVPARHWLEPMDIALLSAAGVYEVPVLKKPLVLLIPTGDEVRSPEEVLKEGEIPETNSVFIINELKDYFDFIVLPPVPNNVDALRSVIDSYYNDVDIIATIAGSSYGERDVTTNLLMGQGSDPDLQQQLYVHGINIKPGKPTILASYREKPFIGFPGFPVSTWVVAKFVLDSLVESYYGLLPQCWQQGKALSGRKIPSEGGSIEFVRGVVGAASSQKGLVFMPLNRGAGAMSSVVRANAVLTIPANSEGFTEGSELELLMRYVGWPLLVASDDIALKFLLSDLRKMGVFLNYVFTGSSTALELLRKNLAAAAGAHLLCPDGSYNTCMAPANAIKVPFVKREQGFMVQRGNPKGIKSVEDLERSDVVFVNRDRGSGTRILLDYLLQQKGLEPDHIKGYDHEEFSHLRVGMCVASGLADVGLGIKFAADVLGLDFVPVAEEEYDLFFLSEYSNLADTISDFIKSEQFRVRLSNMGGYRLVE